MPKLPDTLGALPTPQPVSSVATPSYGEPGVSYTARSLLSAGDTLQAASREMQAEYQKEKAKIDNAKVEDAFNKLRNQQIDLTVGQDNGFINQKGEAAVKKPLLKNYTEKLSSSAKALSDTLDNDEQRQMFKARADVSQSQFSQDLLQHLYKENDVYQKQVTSATIDTETRAAAVKWNNPMEVQASLERINAAVSNEAARQGVDDVVKKDMLLQASGKVHADVINEALVNGNTKYAKLWLDQHKDEMDANAIVHAEQGLKTAGVKNDSLQLSMELQGPLSAKVKTLNQMFSEGKISAEIRDATLQRAEHDWQLTKAQQAEGEKSLLGNAQDWLLKNPEKSVQDMPVTMYNALKNTGHLATMVSFAKSGRFDNDPKTWGEIITMPQSQLASMSPVDFYNKYRSKLDDAHIEHGYALIAQARGEVKDNHLEILSTVERVKQGAKSAGILPYEGKPDEDQAKQYGQFESTIDSRVRAYEATALGGKRKATSDELQKIIDQTLMDKVFVHRSILPDRADIPVSTLKPEDMTSAYVKSGNENIKLTSIPGEQRALIASKLQRRGIPVTEQTVADIWVKAGKPK